MHVQEYLHSTTLRAQRMKALQGLCADNEQQPMVADGAVVADGGPPAHSSGTFKQLAASPAASATPAPAAAAADGAAATAAGADPEVVAERETVAARSCYTCKRRFRAVHEFYDRLCPACASLNFAKRHATADLNGRVALVTGARVKIGYHVALKLLRCGATVLASSRFPADTARRFAAEADAVEWGARLHVYGLDLRDLPRLEAFCQHVVATFDRLDILINNACQTIRRPVAYYSHLLTAEERFGGSGGADGGAGGGADGGAESADGDAGGMMRQWLRLHHSLEGAEHSRQQRITAGGSGVEAAAGRGGEGEEAGATLFGEEVQPFGAPEDLVARADLSGSASGSASSSAALSQVPLTAEDAALAVGSAALPRGQYDVNEQQLDLRTHNSWLCKIEEVSTPEILECFAINALAPFVLNSRLLPLMQVGGRAGGGRGGWVGG
jgi:NAD(P)-dependent dehydrogenase (short-subunit alcohol dehydrogenase family)